VSGPAWDSSGRYGMGKCMTRKPRHVVAMTFAPVHVDHFSDTHLGYERYRALSASGDNQRGTDFVRAFRTTVRDIVAADSPLVIHSGDALDRAHVPTRYLLELRRGLKQLASRRPDGTRRQVVIISGNHDQPSSRREACALELFRDMPGVHVITTRYEVIEFDGVPDSQSEDCDPLLHNVAVHCLPHDVLKQVNFADVQPVLGKVNILTAHGVAGGSDLFLRSLGREFPIPADTLGRDWDYVALGHWHKQGPVALTSGPAKVDGEVGRVWYAGSTENSGFRDLKDNGTRRGWLHVTVRPGDLPLVERRFVPIRNMFRLPHLDLAGKTPEEITQALKDNLTRGDTPIDGAIVGQLVSGVSRDVWSLVDMLSVRSAAAAALDYEVTPEYTKAKPGDVSSDPVGLGNLGEILETQARNVLTTPEIPAALALSRKLLGSALQAGPETATDAPVPGTVTEIPDADPTGKTRVAA
jgi:DNA repair exonuclease SbcCD nuclease subunit